MSLQIVGWPEKYVDEYRKVVAPTTINFWNKLSGFLNSTWAVIGLFFIPVFALVVLMLFPKLIGLEQFNAPGIVMGWVFCLYAASQAAEYFKAKAPIWTSVALPEFSKLIHGSIKVEGPLWTAVTEQGQLHAQAAFEVEYLQSSTFILWMYPRWFDWSNKQAVLMIKNDVPVFPNSDQSSAP